MIRMIRDEEGAVQLYALLLIIPIFLFHAVLIDFIRIKVAEHDAENNVKAGARSVLAGFDPALRPFGLFGLPPVPDRGKTIFATVMEGQQVMPGADHFSFADPSSEPSTFQVLSLYSLANPAIFTHQIQKDMRYRAPIEYALEVVDKWKKSGTGKSIEQTQTYGEAAQALDDLYAKREKAMDEAWQAAQTFISGGRSAYNWGNEQLSKLHELAGEIGVTDLDSIRQSLNDVSNQLSASYSELQSLNQTLDERKDLLQKAKATADEIQQLNGEIESMTEEVQSVKSSISDLQQQQQSISQRLDKAAEYLVREQAAKLEIEADQTQINQSLAAVNDKLGEARRDNAELKEALEQQKAKLRQDYPGVDPAWPDLVVYPAQEWDTYETECGTIAALWNGFRLQWQSTTWLVGTAYDSLSTGLGEFHDKLEQFAQDRSTKEQQRAAANLAEASRRGDQVERTRAALMLLQSRLTGCSSYGDGSTFDSKYKQLQTMLASYGAQTVDPGESMVQPMNEMNVTSAAHTALSLANKLSGALTGVRSELYTDEYALTHFGFRTHPGNAIGDGSGTITGQEVEYALYGYSSCTANEGAAYSEMFLLLFAIRTAENLLSPTAELAAVSTPMLAFLTAIATGAMEAAQDMEKLVNGGSVALVRKLPNVLISYKDLLRMFLILHSNNDHLTARLQALVQLDSGVDLQKANTYVQASASSTLRLWFPGFIEKGLYHIGLTDCNPGSGSCRMTTMAVAAYD